MAVEDVTIFSSAHKIAKSLIVLLALGVVISIIGVYTDGLQLVNGIDVSSNNEMYNDMQTIVSLLALEIIIATIVFFIWFHKVYRNLTALGAKELEFSSKWVIAYFFIPILCFYKPLKATFEIWKSSDPSVSTTDKNLRESLIVPKIFGLWWFFWVMSNLLGFRMLLQSLGDQTATQLYSYAQYSFVDGILTAVTFFLTILIVRKIDSRQEKKAMT